MMHRMTTARLLKSTIDQQIIDDWGLNVVPIGQVNWNRKATAITNTHAVLNAAGAADAKALFVNGYKWGGPSDDDYVGSTWSPQGLSGSGDADPSGLVDGLRLDVATWHDHDTRIRATFVNRDELDNAPANNNYRHVLLVEPYVHPTLGANFKNIPIHAGGVVWYRNWLYVVDTAGGIRVFDVSQLQEPTGNGQTGLMGKQSNGLYHAQDYRYIIPQVARYAPVPPFAMRFSYCGLDQTPGHDPHLVVGEYDTTVSASEPARVYWWGLDPDTGELEVDLENVADAIDGAFLLNSHVQGIHKYREDGATWFLLPNTSTEDLAKVFLDDVTAGTSPVADEVHQWAENPEGQYYVPHPDEANNPGAGGLRGLTELPNKRIVFEVVRSTI